MGGITGHIALLVLAALAGVSSLSTAQGVDRAHLGVVWTPPEPFAEAREELNTMAEFGVSAVRMELFTEPNLHDLTEYAGIAVFQEVDLRFAPASRVEEAEDRLVAAIDSALDVATAAGRETALGLGYWNDTSDPRVCAVIGRLAAAADRPDVRTYYTTPFIEDDVCSEHVDFVLLDSKAGDRPASLVRRWRRVHETPVGIAALGGAVFAGAIPGYRSPESSQAQARAIEEGLTSLGDDAELVAVFVDRWLERRPSALGLVDVKGDWGIHTPDGTARPAASVVRGIYSGRQVVFAYEAGRVPADSNSWINLIAFITAALFGFAYYSSLDLGSLLRRYFVSHSFYLEKVRDGRDTSIGISLFLLACLSVAAGIFGTTVVMQVKDTNTWFVATEMMPDWLSWTAIFGARNPGALLFGFALLFASVAVGWAVALSLLTRATRRLAIDQAMLLTVVPRWPVALIGLLALVILNWSIDATMLVLTIMALVWSFVVIVYTGRILSDYLRLLGFSAVLTLPVLLLALVLGVATLWLVVVSQDLMPELQFIWNLAART